MLRAMMQGFLGEFEFVGLSPQHEMEVTIDHTLSKWVLLREHYEQKSRAQGLE